MLVNGDSTIINDKNFPKILNGQYIKEQYMKVFALFREGKFLLRDNMTGCGNSSSFA